MKFLFLKKPLYVKFRLYFMCLLYSEIALSQATLPAYFGFDSPPEFDPATMKANPNLTGQNGIVDIINGNGAEGTSYFVRMGKAAGDGQATRNSLDLKIDLSGYSGKQLELSFYFNDFQGTNQYYDGVFISDQGSTFKRVIDLQPERWCDNIWGFFRVDLDELIAKYNLAYTSNFIIRFQQEALNDFNWQNEEAFYIDQIVIKEAFPIIPANVPFEDGFASGLPHDPHWVFHTMKFKNAPNDNEPQFSTPYEYTSKINANASDGDGYSLFLGKWKDCGGDQRNIADLHLNLMGLDNADLSFEFDFYHYQDNTNFEDGIWLSDDGGETFKSVTPFLSLELGSWQPDAYGRFPPLDLSGAIKKAGLSFSSDFVIRFQHQDDEDYLWQNFDGLQIDNIKVKILPPVVYKQAPFCDNYDAADINLDHIRTRMAEMDTDGKPTNGTTPSSACGLSKIFGTGPESWHLGKSNDFNGANLNYIDWHIKAANFNTLSLTFDLYEVIEESQTEDGIWLSTDGGINFEKIYDFDWASNPNTVWKPWLLDLSALAQAKGLTLTDQTVVRFQQWGLYDFGWQNEDGYILKNICFSGVVSSKEPIILPTIQIYPNPTSETLHLDILSNFGTNQYRYEIRNPLLRLVLNAPITASNETIDISTLPSGVYILSIYEEGRSLSKKFIKM
jgi:Secretion system C-terminal sorting domain